jgi:hypothetical protein
VRRFARYTVNVLAAISLLLFAMTLCLRARQGRVVGERHEIVSRYFASRHARYTLRADADRIGLWAPPPAAPASLRPDPIPDYVHLDPRPPAELLRLMRNEDVVWMLIRYHAEQTDAEELTFETTYRGADAGARNERLLFTDNGLLIPGLLEALEDPKRAVAAHVFLNSHPLRHVWTLPRRPEGPFSVEYDGMRIDFSAVGEPGTGVSPGGLVDVYQPIGHVDPSQFGSIRAQWHARLDRPVATVTYSCAAAATAFLPAVVLAAFLRRRAIRLYRGRRNLCPNCGYDLRASRDRCPECGTPVATAANSNAL